MRSGAWLSRLVAAGIALTLSSCGGGPTKVGSARLPPPGPFALAPAQVEHALQARGIHFTKAPAARIHSLPPPVSVRVYRTPAGSRFAVLVYASGEISSEAFDSLSETAGSSSFNGIAQGENVIALILHRGQDGPEILSAIDDLGRAAP